MLGWFQEDIQRRHDRIRERLEAGGVINTREFAREFGVSRRTIYRDITALRRKGHNIAGAAGLGYMLRPGGPH